MYGNRIVLFAPLYVGNECTNDCQYCAFRRSNRQEVRRTLDEDEIRAQVEALVKAGHKRLIIVFGEHPRYNPEFIAECVRTVYSVTRRARRNPPRQRQCRPAGPRRLCDREGGQNRHLSDFPGNLSSRDLSPRPSPGTRKSDYLWRLDGMARAMEAGCDDVGIGALFGLYDWRFEVLGLVAHALHLQKHYNVGPHTISFPRLRPASGVEIDEKYLVSDADFKRRWPFLRLSVPYTG